MLMISKPTYPQIDPQMQACRGGPPEATLSIASPVARPTRSHQSACEFVRRPRRARPGRREGVGAGRQAITEHPSLAAAPKKIGSGPRSQLDSRGRNDALRRRGRVRRELTWEQPHHLATGRDPPAIALCPPAGRCDRPKNDNARGR